MSPANELEAILGQDHWLRALAASLVRDPNAADDLVQEAYLRALSSRARPRSPRDWLAGIVRNLWRDRARSEVRRDRRERRVARPETQPSSDELAAEVELQKRVAEAVLALDEPLRRTIVLRYFREQTLESIAASEGIRVSSVHERVQRALALLRRELDRAHGGRREAWVAALLPLARGAGPTAGTLEVALMAGTAKIGAAILVIAAGGVWWWSGGRVERGGETAPAESSAAGPSADPVPEALAVPAREPVAGTAEPTGAAAADENASVVSVHGRVLDPSGLGVGGVELGWRDPLLDDPRARSAADGSYSLLLGEREAQDAGVVSRSPALVTLISGAAHRGWMVVVGPRETLTGTVAEESGAPIEGAELEFRPSEPFYRALGIHATGLDGTGWRTTSDAAGRFELRDASSGPALVLAARARGFADAEVSLAEGGGRGLVITLRRLPRARWLRGVVLDPLGAPVPGASVSAGAEIALSDAAGRFELLWTGVTGTYERDLSGTWRPQKSEALSAVKLGFAPAQEELIERDLELPFVLRLGPSPVAISGRLIDGEGRAVPGVKVWPEELTPFGQEARATADGTRWDHQRWVEEDLCDLDVVGTTDAEGRFEIECLLSRAYSISALDPRTAVRNGPWTIAGGTHDLELVFLSEATTRVAGRVVSARGRPRAGLDLTPLRGEYRAASVEPRTVTTDAEGRFEFDELATEGTELFVTGSYVFETVALDAFPDLTTIELVVPDLCEVQVELSDPTSADALRVLDADGGQLTTMEVSGGGNVYAVSMGTEASLQDGRSRLLLVAETAETLVLFAQGVEVLRLPVRLEPDERTVLRP